MVLPLAAAALPIAGSIFGGVQGYQQSGGDVGTALLGAGLGAAGGAFLPAGLRMAGSALAANPAVSGLLGKVDPKILQNIYKGTQAVKMKGASVLNPVAQAALGSRAAKAALGAGALTAGALAIPGIAGGAANLLSAPVRAATGGLGQVGQLGLGMAGQRPYTPGYQTPGAPYAQIDQFGNITPYGSSITDVYGVPGMARSAETIRQAEASAEGLKRLEDVRFQALEAAEKQSFARQMAAAGIRQNIATQAAMIQGAQNAAREMGLETSRGISQALANRMQYQ